MLGSASTSVKNSDALFVAVENQGRAVCALCRVNACTVYAMRQIVGELQLALSLRDPRLHGGAVKCVRNCLSDVGQ